MTLTLQGFGVELTPITQDKIECIRQWRNHPDVASYMFDQRYITAKQQQQWFDGLDKKYDLRYWLVSYKSQDIGVVYGQSSDQLPLNDTQEIIPGLYLAPDCLYKSSVLAFSPSLVVIDYFFSLDNCDSLVAQVLIDNKSAIRYNETLGYQIEPSEVDDGKKEYITMRLTPDRYKKAKDKLSKILRF